MDRILTFVFDTAYPFFTRYACSKLGVMRMHI